MLDHEEMKGDGISFRKFYKEEILSQSKITQLLLKWKKKLEALQSKETWLFSYESNIPSTCVYSRLSSYLSYLNSLHEKWRIFLFYTIQLDKKKIQKLYPKHVC